MFRNVISISKNLNRNLIQREGNRNIPIHNQPMFISEKPFGIPQTPLYTRMRRKNVNRSYILNKLDPMKSDTYLYIVYYNQVSNIFTSRFIPVNKLFEYQSKHFILRNLNTNLVVFAAGEIQTRAPGNVIFNLQSGTYQVGIINGLKQKGWSDDQITNFYVSQLSDTWKTPVSYTTDSLVVPILKRFTVKNLNLAGIPYQNVPFTVTSWFKKIVMSSSEWPRIFSIDRKVGKRSMFGVVFRMKPPYQNYLVKITGLGTGNFDGEVNNMKKMEGWDGAIKPKFHFKFKIPNDPRLGQLFRRYNNRQPEHAFGVIIMKDFFYGDYKEKGDVSDFMSRHTDQNSRAIFLNEIRRLVSFLHGKGVIHGDLNPGNILYKIDTNNNIHLTLIDFGNSALGRNSNLPAMSHTVSKNIVANGKGIPINRPLYANKIFSNIIRVSNKWYLNTYYPSYI